MTIWRMRIACWIPKATNNHSEYVIFIGFLQQQWLHERAPLLRYMSIARLVLTTNSNYFPIHHQIKLCASLKDNDSVFCDIGIETV
jgi:hypothetical protein